MIERRSAAHIPERGPRRRRMLSLQAIADGHQPGVWTVEFGLATCHCLRCARITQTDLDGGVVNGSMPYVQCEEDPDDR